MDTDDGILGTNMYAYCHNDPVGFADPSGFDRVTPWYKKAGLSWPGEIHKAVQAYIAFSNPGIIPEVSIPLKGATNIKADLRRGQELWEVKPANNAITNYFESGKNQLKGYIDRAKYETTKGYEQYFTKGGMIASNTFYYYSTLGFGYQVSYWYAGEGVIQYTYERVLIDEAFVEVAVKVALGAWAVVGLTAFLMSGGTVQLPNSPPLLPA
jgi:hypothetical protein